MTRSAAIARAEAYFDTGAFRNDMARRVAMPTESQNPRGPVLLEYLDAEMKPALESLGFTCRSRPRAAAVSLRRAMEDQ